MFEMNLVTKKLSGTTAVTRHPWNENKVVVLPGFFLRASQQVI